MTVSKRRIGILVSGRPGHRELALRQSEAIANALHERGHEAIPVFLDRELDLLVRQVDISCAFVALQGRYGADGCLQGFLEILGIPYTGSGVLASSLARNQLKTKELLRFHNLPTAPGYVFYGGGGPGEETLTERHAAFGYPVTVRPVSDLGSTAETIAYDEMDLETLVEHALRSDDEVLIERHLAGKTLWVGVLDGQALGAVEAMRGRPSRAALAEGPASAPLLHAARLAPERLRSVLRLGTLAYEALGCEGAACVAVQVSERGNEIIREVDTMPALTPTSPLPRIAQLAGINFADLVERLLAGARVRAHGHRDNQRQVQITHAGHERRAGGASHAH